MFGISYQKAGLNWPGRYKAWSRERGLAEAWRAWLQRNSSPQRRRDTENRKCSGNGELPLYPPLGKRGNTEREHAKWRRITGITGAVEETLTAKKRREGLGRLVRWIEERVQHEDSKARRHEERTGIGFRVSGFGNGGTDVSGQLSVVSGSDGAGRRPRYGTEKRAGRPHSRTTRS